MSKQIKYSEAMRKPNFGKPAVCPECNKQMKPVIHPRIVKEGFLSQTRMAELRYGKCEHCGHEFEYWG